MAVLLSRVRILRRSALTLLAGTLALTLGASASAQTYPNKPIRLVVTFPSGGAPDILARLFSEKAQLGQPVVVDNKPGASGNLGAQAVASAAPDGHTLLMAINSFTMTPAIYKGMPFDPVADFAPVGKLAEASFAFVLNPAVPAKDMKQLIELVKKSGGKIKVQMFHAMQMGVKAHGAGLLGHQGLTGTFEVVLFEQQLRPGLAQQGLAGIAQLVFHGRVDIGDEALGIGHHHQGGQQRQQRQDDGQGNGVEIAHGVPPIRPS